MQHPYPAGIAVRGGHVEANGITLCYEDWGDEADEAVLLVMGLSAQLIFWPERLCEGLVRLGYRVIRFDNRDVGQSSRVQGHKLLPSDLTRALVRSQLGLKVKAPYTLYDMADDAAGLLDALGIAKAHVVGASMGGMISQIIGSRHSDRVATLTLIMTASMAPLEFLPAPRMLLKLLNGEFARSISSRDADSVIGLMAMLRGRGIATTDEEMQHMAERVLARTHKGQGALRQMLAIMATGRLTGLHADIKAPTLVLHGSDDPLLTERAGRALARRIPNADFMSVRGMGHDLPPALMPAMAGWMHAHFVSNPAARGQAVAATVRASA